MNSFRELLPLGAAASLCYSVGMLPPESRTPVNAHATPTSASPCNAIARRAALLTLAAAAFTRAAFAIDTRNAAPTAPKFSAKTLDGERLNNESLKGKVVLIQFWATWCGYCRADQSAVNALASEFADKGLVVLAVNAGESRRKVQTFLEASPRAGKIVLAENTNLCAMFAAKSYPLYELIDRNGNMAGEQRGAGGEHALRRLLAKAGLE